MTTLIKPPIQWLVVPPTIGLGGGALWDDIAGGDAKGEFFGFEVVSGCVRGMRALVDGVPVQLFNGKRFQHRFATFKLQLKDIEGSGSPINVGATPTPIAIKLFTLPAQHILDDPELAENMNEPSRRAYDTRKLWSKTSATTTANGAELDLGRVVVQPFAEYDARSVSAMPWTRFLGNARASGQFYVRRYISIDDGTGSFTDIHVWSRASAADPITAVHTVSMEDLPILLPATKVTLYNASGGVMSFTGALYLTNRP